MTMSLAVGDSLAIVQVHCDRRSMFVEVMVGRPENRVDRRKARLLFGSVHQRVPRPACHHVSDHHLSHTRKVRMN